MAAREVQQPFRMKAGALLWTLEPFLLVAGSESQSHRPLPTPLVPPSCRLLPALYPTGSAILVIFFLSPWTTKASQFCEDSSHEIYSFDYFP